MWEEKEARRWATHTEPLAHPIVVVSPMVAPGKRGGHHFSAMCQNEEQSSTLRNPIKRDLKSETRNTWRLAVTTAKSLVKDKIREKKRLKTNRKRREEKSSVQDWWLSLGLVWSTSSSNQLIPLCTRKQNKKTTQSEQSAVLYAAAAVAAVGSYCVYSSSEYSYDSLHHKSC